MTEQRRLSNEQQQLKETFDKEIKRYLASEEYHAKKPTYEEFKAMVEDYKKNTPWYKKLWTNIEIWWATRDVRK